MKPKVDKSKDELGTYIRFKRRKRRDLVHHPTDFTVAMNASSARQALSVQTGVSQVSPEISRVTAEDAKHRDELMRKVQSDGTCAIHHVYRLDDTKEELVIADGIYLTLRDDRPETLKSILDKFPELEEKRRIGRTIVLQVTERTTRNPLKIANQIAVLDGVEHCSPKILPRIRRNNAQLAPSVDLSALGANRPLVERQWHLFPSDSAKGASINVQEAWGLLKDKKLGDGTGFGDPNIVIAVIDDGFDVGRAGPPANVCHPVFFGKEINQAARNLGSGEPGALLGDNDFHGTAVASIITGSLAGNGMLAVAPSCGFLPIRIAMDSNIDLEVVLDALQIASESADVVNCSFGLAPSSFDIMGENSWFRERVKEMAATGGRRGKGLVIVFGAGNDDAPTFLSAKSNKQGIRFPIEIGGGALELGEIKRDFEIHSGFPEIPGVVVVAAMSSSRRKAGYSNWGSHVTVAAPSDNGHDMTRLGNVDFKAANGYPGLGLVAAVNQPGHGQTGGAFFQPLAGNIPGIAALFYTDGFGRTSGAAPIVSGVVALMLSANDQLTAKKVIGILKDKTDTDLVFDLDLENDPNLQGVSGKFDGKHSLFFGFGKIDAGKAVQAAFDLRKP